MSKTLARYFGARFLTTFLAIFAGVFGLVMLVDYLEMMRRHADVPHASALMIAKASLYRVPQIVERVLPFAVLVAGMSSFVRSWGPSSSGRWVSPSRVAIPPPDATERRSV